MLVEIVKTLGWLGTGVAALACFVAVAVLHFALRKK